MRSPVPGLMLLSGRAVAWLIGDGSRPGPFMVGEKRLDTFGPVPVRDGSGPVECCLPLVSGHVADSFRCCPLVHAGGTLVRLGRMAERLHAGGQHFCCGSVRLSSMALSHCQPLAGGDISAAPNGVPASVSVSELLKPRADGIEPSVDLPPTVWRWLGLAVHVS
jgi:hypothetical protein